VASRAQGFDDLGVQGLREAGLDRMGEKDEDMHG
jgi:hypothetical protein